MSRSTVVLAFASVFFLPYLTGCASAGNSTARSARPAPIDIGAFTLTQDELPLTGKRTPAISTFDNEQNAMLGLWCLENGLSVLVGLSGDVAQQAREVEIRYTFDGGSPSPQTTWIVQRQNGFAIAYLRPDLTAAFDSAAVSASAARVEVFNPTNNAVTVYRFSLDGITEARARLTCPYPEWP